MSLYVPNSSQASMKDSDSGKEPPASDTSPSGSTSINATAVQHTATGESRADTSASVYNNSVAANNRRHAQATTGVTDGGMAVPRNAAARAVLIEREHIDIGSELKSAFLKAAQTAFKCTAMGLSENLQHVHTDLFVQLRHMVLLQGPTDMHSTEFVEVPSAQAPHAFGRMVVQIPCKYTAGPRGTVSVNTKGHTKTYTLDSSPDEGFRYVFSYSPSTMHVHAPRQGCCAFLV
jgi:hypothetical protein